MGLTCFIFRFLRRPQYSIADYQLAIKLLRIP